MPLEFALRPRFDLERTLPRRKRSKLRISPLALPMLAYWLAIAGATKLLLPSAPDEPVRSDPRPAVIEQLAAIDPAPSLPSSTPAPAVPAPSATTTVVAEPSFQPAPGLPVAPEPVRELERSFEPSSPVRHAAVPHVAERPTPPPPVVGLTHAQPSTLENPPAKHEWEAPVGHESERAVAREVERPVAREPERPDARVAALPSCESAAASANQSMDLRAGPGAPDLSREALAAVLENGAYLRSCAIPARTAVEICAAVQDGKAVGVSVTSEPRDANVNTCVRRAVAALRFPQSARLDVTRTRFAAVR